MYDEFQKWWRILTSMPTNGWMSTKQMAILGRHAEGRPVREVPENHRCHFQRRGRLAGAQWREASSAHSIAVKIDTVRPTPTPPPERRPPAPPPYLSYPPPQECGELDRRLTEILDAEEAHFPPHVQDKVGRDDRASLAHVRRD